jgi:hypothetical protein
MNTKWCEAFKLILGGYKGWVEGVGWLRGRSQSGRRRVAVGSIDRDGVSPKWTRDNVKLYDMMCEAFKLNLGGYKDAIVMRVQL